MRQLPRGEGKSDDEVLELSAKGLEIAVAEHPLVLVLLYAPKWFMDERERRLIAGVGEAEQAARERRQVRFAEPLDGERVAQDVAAQRARYSREMQAQRASAARRRGGGLSPRA